MKNLWKYLSTLGLMLVACLCLGVGLKASGVSFGATAIPEITVEPPSDGAACVYIANGKHEMKGGTIGGKAYGIYISGGTFTMSGGTISNCSSYGVYVSGGTFNYSAGTISDEIYLSSSKYITLTKAPTSTLKIRLSSTSSGTRVAYLSGISSLTSTQLSYLNVVNMPSGYRLEVSSGYVVLAQSVTNYTVTISAGTGGSVSRTSVSVPSGTTFSTSGRTLSFGNGTSVTATANTGYSFDYWSPSSGTITSSRTIYAYFSKNQTTTNYTVTISAGTGGSVSTRSVSVPSGTTFSTSGSRLTFSNGTSVTATANSGYSFSYWSPSNGTITSSTTIYAYFSKNSTPTPPDPSIDIDDNDIPGWGGTGRYFVVGIDEGRILSPYEKALVLLIKDVLVDGASYSLADFDDYINEGYYLDDPSWCESHFIYVEEVPFSSLDELDGYYGPSNERIDIYFPATTMSWDDNKPFGHGVEFKVNYDDNGHYIQFEDVDYGYTRGGWIIPTDNLDKYLFAGMNYYKFSDDPYTEQSLGYIGCTTGGFVPYDDFEYERLENWVEGAMGWNYESLCRSDFGGDSAAFYECVREMFDKEADHIVIGKQTYLMFIETVMSVLNDYDNDLINYTEWVDLSDYTGELPTYNFMWINPGVVDKWGADGDIDLFELFRWIMDNTRYYDIDPRTWYEEVYGMG